MRQTFRALLMEGIRRFGEHGYTSEVDLQEWLTRLQAALEAELPSDEESKALLAKALGSVYARDLRSGIMRRVPGVSRYTLDRVAPSLRAELDRRIFAGADLIRIRKRAEVEKTLQRFAGWASSVPPEGAIDFSPRKISKRIAGSIDQLKFERRRVAIDQAAKMMANVSHVVAMNEGAIAGIWHDRGSIDHGYDARPEHLARSGKLFLIRDSWAIRDGLIRRGAATYTDQITEPSQEVFCACWYEWITQLNRIPKEMLTAKGRAFLGGARLDSATKDRQGKLITEAELRECAKSAIRCRTCGAYVVNDKCKCSVSPAQIEAGNYPKGHIRRHGLEITIETRAGETRSGVGPDGRPWSVTMPADYGYLRRTVGADGEQIDCYIGPDEEASKVWVVDQLDANTRAFDEQKVFIGFLARSQALATYESGFSDGRGKLRIGAVHEIPVERFLEQVRAWRTLLSD